MDGKTVACHVVTHPAASAPPIAEADLPFPALYPPMVEPPQAEHFGGGGEVSTVTLCDGECDGEGNGDGDGDSTQTSGQDAEEATGSIVSTNPLDSDPPSSISVNTSMTENKLDAPLEELASVQEPAEQEVPPQDMEEEITRVEQEVTAAEFESKEITKSEQETMAKGVAN
ncbi:MAG: hypothetical protein Pyrs2KO_34920 [Pyruvatibacter sp.]